MANHDAGSSVTKYRTPTFQSNTFVWNINDFRNNRKYSSNFFQFCGYSCYLYLEASDTSAFEDYTTYVILGIQGYPAPYKRDISCHYSIILKNEEGDVCASLMGEIQEAKESFQIDFDIGQLKNKIHSRKFPSICFSWCEDGHSEVCSSSVQTEPECTSNVLKTTSRNAVADPRLSDMCTTKDKEAYKYLTNLSRDLGSFFVSETDTDCVLKVGEIEFSVHRSVLSARSKVFAAMFHHNTSESQTGEVDIQDIDAGILGDVLYFIYTAKIRGLSPNTAASMLAAADKYAIIDLKEACLDFLMRNMTVDNVCEVVLLAHKHADLALANKAMQFIKERIQ